MIRARFLVLAALAAPAAAQMGTTERMSVDALGAEGDGVSVPSAISANGRFVAFVSSSTNLVPNDTNAFSDVFVRDLATGSVERVSVANDGSEANGWSSYPSISADGRFVCFACSASNLVANDVNGYGDVFVRDRLLGTTELVDVTASGGQTDSFTIAGSISADGRYVTFVSFSAIVVAGDGNGGRDVFLRDRLLGTTERVSVGLGGADSDGDSSGNLALSFASKDGRYVAFSSHASNLVTGDTNGVIDVFVRDRVAGTTQRVSVGPGGAQADDDCDVTAMTSDGRFIAFQSGASNLVAGDTNQTVDAFVVDRTTGVVERVSVDSSGVEGSGPSFQPTLSSDGRFVFFLSDAPDLVPLDFNGLRDGFRRDRNVGRTERFVLAYNGAEPDRNIALLSPDASGNHAVFASDALTLVQNDTNDAFDVFLRTVEPSTSFCAGDGTAAACPCGNAGAWRAGCASSSTPGAWLTAEGTPSVAQDSLALVVRDVPPGTTAMFLQGATQLNGGSGAPFGDGLRCVGGVIKRLGVRVAFGGSATLGGGIASEPSLSVLGAVPGGGDWRYYQVWYRNAAAFCTSGAFNFSQGAAVLWTP